MSSWVLRECDPNLASVIAGDLNISDHVACLIAQRGGQSYQRWVDPRLSDSLLDVSDLKEIDRLYKLLCDAKTIGIYSDYDVDGVLSAVMWREFCTFLGKKVVVYIPDRKDGYGANTVGIEKLQSLLGKQDNDPDACALLFLDCGTDQDLSAVKIPCAILDHHVVKNNHNNHIFINPHRSDLDFDKVAEFMGMCTAGLSLMIIGRLAHMMKSKFNVMTLVDLAAVATVADVMQLTGINRAIVRRGLQVMNHRPRPVFEMIMEGRRIFAEDIAYKIGPVLNAPGRMALADQSLNLFGTISAAILNDVLALNEKRKAEEADTLSKAVELIDGEHAFVYSGAIIVCSAEWNLGIVGIVASRLKEKYNKTVFVLKQTGDVLKGSVRGVKEFDVGRFVASAVAAKLIEGGGGHKAAGGVVLRSDQLEVFAESLSGYPTPDKPHILVDAVVSLSALQCADFSMLEPFGCGNPAPQFFLKNVILDHFVMIKEKYARLRISQFCSNISVMAFDIDTSLLSCGAMLNMIVRYSRGGYIAQKTWIANES